MKDIAQKALDAAQLKGASYADVRVVHHRVQEVEVRDGKVAALADQTSRGFGVRVLVDGAWGFAASSSDDSQEPARVAAHAVAIARASALVHQRPVDLGPPAALRARYRTPVQQDPFAVPLEAKIALLLDADARMRAVKGVAATHGSLGCEHTSKLFANTEGAWIEQELTETGGGIVATAVSDADAQTRSYPNSFGRHQATRGWELIEAIDLPANAQRIAEEAVALLTAPVCPTRVTTLVLDPTQVALQVHESIGHAIELDRVFGMEASFAGTSFLDPGMRGTFRYGSDLVNVSADATLTGGLGSFGFDDEGVPAQRTPVIEKGIFKGFLMSRETASQLGIASNGTMRADGWQRIPLIRMTNINLEPGTWRFEDLIADTDDGVYMQTNRSWSIDDRRLNFQFGTELAWEIKGGRLTRMLRNPTYTGLTPRFWGSCDAICGPDEWQIWGTPNCGKGQPGQTAHVGHGAAAARFRDVQIGVLA